MLISLEIWCYFCCLDRLEHVDIMIPLCRFYSLKYFFSCSNSHSGLLSARTSGYNADTDSGLDQGL